MNPQFSENTFLWPIHAISYPGARKQWIGMSNVWPDVFSCRSSWLRAGARALDVHDFFHICWTFGIIAEVVQHGCGDLGSMHMNSLLVCSRFFVPKYVWNPNQHDAFLKRKIKNIQNALPRCCCFLLVLQTNSAALSHHPMFKLFATKMSLIINHLIRWIKRHLHSGWQGCCPRKNAQICLGNLTVWPIRIIPEYVYSRISMCSLMKHWCWKWISVDYIADVSQVHIEDRRASFKPWIRREHEVGCRWCQISLTRKQTC
jgi:hypothetical protein